MIEIIILSLLGLGGIVFGIDEATNDDNNSTTPSRSGEEFEGDSSAQMYTGTDGDDFVEMPAVTTLLIWALATTKPVWVLVLIRPLVATATTASTAARAMTVWTSVSKTTSQMVATATT